jgi:hypothetical protein
MDIAMKTENFSQDDQSWLGSAYGTDEARTITLKTSAFTAGTHYPNGYFPSGLPLGRYTSGGNVGFYGPYTAGATDGTQTLAGFLLTAVDAPQVNTTNVAGALLDHGRVIVAKLPISVDATAQGTNSRFIYV